AKRAGAMVVTTAAAKDTSYVRWLGAYGVIDYGVKRFEEQVKDVDAVLDTVGGDILERSYEVLKRGGILVSSAAQPSEEKAQQHGVRARFLRAEGTSEAWNQN